MTDIGSCVRGPCRFPFLRSRELRRRHIAKFIALVLLLPPMAIASTTLLATPASAAVCNAFYVDCTIPTDTYSYCNLPDTEIVRIRQIDNNGYVVAAAYMRYNPTCRTVWTRETFSYPNYTLYYCWVQRQTGPYGDGYGTVDIYNSQQYWNYSTQLYDANFLSVSWGAWSPGNDIFDSRGPGLQVMEATSQF